MVDYHPEAFDQVIMDSTEVIIYYETPLIIYIICVYYSLYEKKV